MSRGKGTGSVFQRAKDDRWVAMLDVGFTPSGNRKRISKSYPTQAAAEAGLKAMLREFARNGAPASTRGMTVKAWSDKWLALYETTARPATFIAARGAVRNYIVPTIGRRQLAHLTPADVRKVQQAARDAGLAGSSVLRTHAVLTTLLKAAQGEGFPVPQSVFVVKRPSKSNTANRDAIERDDAIALIRAAQGRPDASRRAAVMLQGLRPAEALGLTWQAVDFEAGEIDVSWQLKPLPYKKLRDPSSGFRIPNDYEVRHLTGAFHLVRPKSEAGSRIIPLVPWLAGALKAWQAEAPSNPWGLIWTHKGRPYPDDVDRAEWVDLQDAAQVARIESTPGSSAMVGRRYDLYDCRHTAASLLLELGVDSHIVTAIMGHTSIATSRGYQHANSKMMRAALETAADLLMPASEAV